VFLVLVFFFFFFFFFQDKVESNFNSGLKIKISFQKSHSFAIFEDSEVKGKALFISSDDQNGLV